MTEEHRQRCLQTIAEDAAERLEREHHDHVLYALHVACGALALGHQGRLDLPPRPTPPT